MIRIPYDATRWQVVAAMREASLGVHYTIPKLPAWVGARVLWPFGGAAARVAFFVRETPEIGVSTYLDVVDALGVMGKPYFEIYPAEDGDTARFLPEEEAEMYAAVVRSLRKMRAKHKRGQV
jgi:hypothetical protein